ncbi:cytochrome P450 [Boeremia exigua]|uniref:cytochrome P450 n=1 Tax=Boeremia exigua TaxID=749465 RepID=UPI001E8EA2F8|nr:cytochrome P450 [Boeremia exigua]KAH6629738.1 cytochrome P450 [Boeremia exigua]
MEIPEPSKLPLLGHITSIDNEFPLGSMIAHADQCGEAYRLRFPGRTVVIVSTQALVNETCDEKRFKKSINSALNNVRDGVHDGLFTARMGEENWGIAHRILMPAFGPLSIQGMFDDMHDIATQLTLKWARQGPDYAIPVTDDFTRLTLDTLALCSMGYRFNSYYQPELHPFVEAMGEFLTEAGEKPRRPPIPSMFYRTKDQKYEADIKVMRDTAREVLEARKEGHTDRHDLLAAMMKGVDPKTGKKMTDESIMDNLITFLIAGHETTSGLLSFVFYQLLKHPEAMQKAKEEVDDVCGRGPIKVEHMSRLPYINAVLRETLRINATIPLFTVEAFEDTTIGGKYPVKAGETIVNLLAKSQLDPKVFGSDANQFKPERMLDEPFERVTKEFPNCWKPFGNGMRGCIGRPFAWQESLLVMAMLLQTFTFVLEPDYTLGFKQTLTIKPKDMHMRAILRDDLDPTSLGHRLSGQPVSKNKATSKAAHAAHQGNGAPLTILYGSNTGTCESLAQRVATDATTHGFKVTKLDCMDSANGALPTDQPVLIITASFEGEAPDNAGHFIQWMEKQDKNSQSMKGVSYAVFGCGNREWTQTFHRIPKLVDTTLAELGAERLADIGLSDVSQGQVFSDFENWEDNVYWPALTARYDVKAEDQTDSPGVKVTISTPRASTLRQEVKAGVVVKTRVLTNESESDNLKKHLEIRLPEDMTYSPGDYLVVLPFNPRETVNRVLRRFSLPWDAQLEISAEGPTTLPTNTALPAQDILSSYVELSQPASKRSLLLLAGSATNGETNSALLRLANDAFSSEISAKRVSILDLLERFSDITLPFATFISLMPPMRVRQYSISSSPMTHRGHATITYSSLKEASLSGQGVYHGVASSYLSSLTEGDNVQVAVRPSHAAFSLPSEPETVPIICIAAGTGIAPFRGFLEQRAAILASGRKLAPALLFFGCRSPDRDDLYRDELDEWQRQGIVEVRRAYSRDPTKSEGCKYAQDRMVHDGKLVAKLWQDGAKIYVCGSRGLADSAREAIIKIKLDIEKGSGGDSDMQKAQEWFDSLRNMRYVTDVFD